VRALSFRWFTGLALAVLSLPVTATAQGRRSDARDTASADSAPGRKLSAGDSLKLSEIANQPPVVTHHTMQLDGKALAYTATTGMMAVRDEETGVAQGYIFYVAYKRDNAGDPGKRPLTFVFNGGPGSSTVWLHMGAFGPRRVKLMPDGAAPPPPYTYEDNPYTLLDQSDLVFLDPVGTGYSRPANPKLGAKFWGVNEDIASVAEFIRSYLTAYERWASPKYLAGESYGTTRAAGLSGYLANEGIALNGITLISTILDFGLDDGDNAAIYYLPSYTAIAWYHKQLPADLQSQTLEQVTDQAERWAGASYRLALARGNDLTAAERQAAVDTLARFTGLSRTVVDQANLRISLGLFDTELLRDQRLTVGRLDGRFTAFSMNSVSQRPAFDPSEAGIRLSYTPVLNDYMRRELGYKNDLRYYILGGGVDRWSPQSEGSPTDVTPSLETAFAKNPHMKLFVAMGYYDTATPYYAVEYTLSHLAIGAEARRNITTGYFKAGHMVYIDDASMKQFRADLAEWMGR
jgi:carboxypeptidase C (cathepsin A)